MDVFDIIDWRRRTFALYAAVRDTPDPAEAHSLWRRTREEMFRTHPASPLPDPAAFTGLPVPPYDPGWRFEVAVQDAPSARIELATGTDGAVPFERVGVAELPGVGSLDVWRLASYGGGLFVPVRDRSAGREGGTYGGGRYLVDTVKGADLGGTGRSLVLALNFASTPPCASAPAGACRLAQRGNVVDGEIRGGERG